jgi:hypothetical protein
MNDKLHAGMREASRLTRAGRLIDATALLQGVLQTGRDRTSFASNGYVPPTIELTPEAVEVPDAVPSPPQSAVRAHLPAVLRGFLDRVTPTVPERGQFLTKSYSSRVGSRNYKLYVPSQYRSQPLPLIVMLHGCTQSPDDFATGTRVKLRAEEYNCFVAYQSRRLRPTSPSAGTGFVRATKSGVKASRR